VNDDVVLLTGVQRSGTTALGACLAESYHERDDLFTVNGKLLYLLQRWLTDDDLAARHLRSDEIWHALGRRRPIGPATQGWLAQVDDALRWAAQTVADAGWSGNAHELAAEILAASYGGHARRWGEKYNESMLDVAYLEATVPRARVLLLFRHPVDVARSTERWTGDRPWRPSDFQGCLSKWRAWNDTALAALADSGLDVLAVEHVRLCTDPLTRRRVADFAGVTSAALESGLRRPEQPAAEGDLPSEVDATWTALMSEMEKRR